jgi:putative Holliday junction resolvase
MSSATETLLCLDVGAVRIGVARANAIARIAEPLKTVTNDDVVVNTLKEIIDEAEAKTVVVGLPQNRNQEDTEQTRFVRDFIARLQATVSVEFVFQDEAESSIKAEAILKQRGKPYAKEDIDAEAATLILQDYIEEQA